MSISDKLVTVAQNVERVYEAGRGSVKLENKTVRINKNGWYYPNVAEGYDGIGSLQIQVNTPQNDYEAGKSAEYNSFWDNFQNYGQRRLYTRAFDGQHFNSATFYPKYDIIAEGDASQMLYGWRSNSGTMPVETIDLAQRLIDCGVTLDTSAATNLDSAFAYSNFSRIPTIDCSSHRSGESYGLFAHCREPLKSIEKIIVNENMSFKNWFINDMGLESVTIEGIIGQNGFDVSQCAALTHESLISIISALKNYSGQTNDTSGQVSGAYYWNDTVAPPTQEFDQTVSFTSNGEAYCSIKAEGNTFGYAILFYGFDLKQMGYEGGIGYGAPCYDGMNVGAWGNYEKVYRLIDFGTATQTVGEDFWNFLTSNATKLSHTLTLGAANIEKLSESEIAEATQKGWTIA